jgi:hypothetical protein
MEESWLKLILEQNNYGINIRVGFQRGADLERQREEISK